MSDPHRPGPDRPAPDSEPRAADPATAAPLDPSPPAPGGEPSAGDGGAALRRPRTPRLPPDGYAIGALVTAILALFPVAVVLGHIALARVRVYGVGGHGIAVAALVIGYLGLVVGLAAWALYFAVIAPAVTLP